MEAVPASQKVPPKGSQPATVSSLPIVPGQPLVPLVAAHNAALLKSGVFKEPIPLHTGAIAPMQIVSPQILTPVKRSNATGPLQAPIQPKIARPNENVGATIVPIQMEAPQQTRPNQSSDVHKQRSGEETPVAQIMAPTVGQSARQPLRPGEQKIPPEAQLAGPGGQAIGSDQVPKQVSQPVDVARSMQPNPQKGTYQIDPLLAGPGEYRTPRPPVLPQEKVLSMHDSQWGGAC